MKKVGQKSTSTSSNAQQDAPALIQDNQVADLKRLEIDLNNIAEKLDAVHETLRAGHEAGERADKVCAIAADAVLAQGNALSDALECLDQIQEALQAGETPATDTKSDDGDMEAIREQVESITGAINDMTCRMSSTETVAEAIINGGDGRSGDLADAIVVLMQKASEEAEKIITKLHAVSRHLGGESKSATAEAQS